MLPETTSANMGWNRKKLSRLTRDRWIRPFLAVESQEVV